MPLAGDAMVFDLSSMDAAGAVVVDPAAWMSEF
jgi:hypothetical protein